jgi:hypothetical protein
MTEYDERQFARMLERLNAFEEHKISLAAFIADLNGLLCALENPDTEWRNDFQKQWGILEDIHASALDRAIATHPEMHQSFLSDAIGHMRALLDRVAR